MVLDHNVTLANDTLILYVDIRFFLRIALIQQRRVWISSEDVKDVAAKGFKLIHAASDYFYLVRYVCSYVYT